VVNVIVRIETRESADQSGGKMLVIQFNEILTCTCHLSSNHRQLYKLYVSNSEGSRFESTHTSYFINNIYYCNITILSYFFFLICVNLSLQVVRGNSIILLEALDRV